MGLLLPQNHMRVLLTHAKIPAMPGFFLDLQIL